MAYAANALRVRGSEGATGQSGDLTKSFLSASYVTNDAPATVEAADYFNSGAARLPVGTVINAVMSRNATPVYKNYVVTANSGTAVTVALQQTDVGAASASAVLSGVVSTKGTDAAVYRWVAPFKFRIDKLTSILNAALATGDATVTLAIGGTAVTGGVATITQSGSAAGDIDTATPTALNTGAAGAVITATVGGTSSATGTANLQLDITEVI